MWRFCFVLIEKKNLNYIPASTRGSSALHSIFPWYVTRNEAKEPRGLEFYKTDAENNKKHAFRSVTTWLAEQDASYPQCFMFCGLSIRMASLIFRSWSGHALVTVILWSSDCLGLLGVGWRTTCTEVINRQ